MKSPLLQLVVLLMGIKLMLADDPSQGKCNGQNVTYYYPTMTALERGIRAPVGAYYLFLNPLSGAPLSIYLRQRTQTKFNVSIYSNQADMLLQTNTVNCVQNQTQDYYGTKIILNKNCSTSWYYVRIKTYDTSTDFVSYNFRDAQNYYQNSYFKSNSEQPAYKFLVIQPSDCKQIDSYTIYLQKPYRLYNVSLNLTVQNQQNDFKIEFQSKNSIKTNWTLFANQTGPGNFIITVKLPQDSVFYDSKIMLRFIVNYNIDNCKRQCLEQNKIWTDNCFFYYWLQNKQYSTCYLPVPQPQPLPKNKTQQKNNSKPQPISPPTPSQDHSPSGSLHSDNVKIFIGISVGIFIFIVVVCCIIKKPYNICSKSAAPIEADMMAYQQSIYQQYSKDKVCAICLDIGCNAKLQCKHTFHQVCIRAWLNKNGNCPYCRKECDLSQVALIGGQ